MSDSVEPRKIDPEKNRQILADRGCWPPGALDACRGLERRFPDWYAWWTDHPWRRDGQVPDVPCFGAAPIRNARAGLSLFAPTTAELAEQIHEAELDRAAVERYRRPPWEVPLTDRTDGSAQPTARRAREDRASLERQRKLDEHIAAIVDAAPPLTPEQVARLRDLLRPPSDR